MAPASSSRSEDLMHWLRDTTYHGMVCERWRGDVDWEECRAIFSGRSLTSPCPLLRCLTPTLLGTRAVTGARGAQTHTRTVSLYSILGACGTCFLSDGQDIEASVVCRGDRVRLRRHWHVSTGREKQRPGRIVTDCVFKYLPRYLGR